MEYTHCESDHTGYVFGDRYRVVGPVTDGIFGDGGFFYIEYEDGTEGIATAREIAADEVRWT